MKTADPAQLSLHAPGLMKENVLSIAVDTQLLLHNDTTATVSFVDKSAALLKRPDVAATCETTCSVRDLLQANVQAKMSAHRGRSGAEEEDAFFVGDLGSIRRQHAQWCALLPRIQPFYAVKCNPDPVVLGTLASLGVGFDCASRAEIATVRELGVDSGRLIYANPCKQSSHIRYAASQNVRMMTFDNMEELDKIKQNYPQAQLVLRILTDDSRSICKLGTKFGAHLSTTKALLAYAFSLGLDVIGISFHVGSGCFDSAAFRDAVTAARIAFDQASEVGYELRLLDVGGGFPGSDADGITFAEIAGVLGPAVDEMFPPHIRVIAEPGRYFVSAAFTLAVNVTARRTVVHPVEGAERQKSFMLYVNDGVYGSFNCILFDHAAVTPRVLCRDGQFCYGRDFSGEPDVHCSIWGPTCDSMDCIAKSARLPEVDVGDWLYFADMGAYTMCAASTFNGFKKSAVQYTNTMAASQQ